MNLWKLEKTLADEAVVAFATREEVSKLQEEWAQWWEELDEASGSGFSRNVRQVAELVRERVEHHITQYIPGTNLHAWKRRDEEMELAIERVPG